MRTMCTDEELGLTTSFTVALNHLKLQVRITNCPKRMSPSSSSFDPWLGQFDWHTRRKHDAEGTLPERFSQHSLLSFLWNFKGSWKKVISHVALCYRVWHFFVNHGKSPSAPGCHIWFAFFFLHKLDAINLVSNDLIWCQIFWLI